MGLASPSGYRPSLVIYVAWHPGAQASGEAGDLARGLYAHLDRDPSDILSRGVGIPVFFRSSPGPDGSLPNVPLDDAEQTVIVLLIDDAFILDDRHETFARDVATRVAASLGRHHVIPVQVGANALQLGNFNSIPLGEGTPAERLHTLTTHVTHALCRRLLAHTRARSEPGAGPLSAAPVQLFLSHAKRDHGKDLAQRFRSRLNAHPTLDIETFFDTRDIPVGTDFAREIEGQIERSAVIAFQTDAYASRPWCRREILIAKRYGVPVIVVNAVATAEERTFPYLGNTPSIRWDLDGPDHSQEVLDLALREVLRAVYTRFHLASLQSAGWIPPDAKLRPHLPEVITCLAGAPAGPPGGPQLVVYPDPPLGHEEMELLGQANPQMQLATPTALSIRRRPDGKLPFEGRRIALSISDSGDLRLLGMGETHLRAVYIELARHLLAAGAILLYGGDLRSGGFTDALIDLVLEHRRSARDLEGSIASFLAWPESKRLTQSDEASLRPQLVFRKVDESTGLSTAEQGALLNRIEQIRGAGTSLTDAAVEDRDRLAANLTRMRQLMNDELEARIVLGGKVTGFTGTAPGIAEEAYLAIAGKRPLFVIGGFGGCARAIADSLRARPSPGLQAAAQDPTAQTLAAHRKGRGTPAATPEDAAAVDAYFRACGIAALRNGLSPVETERLFETVHVPELVSLIMTGLTRLWP